MTETINDYSEVTRPNLIGIDASHEPPEAPDFHTPTTLISEEGPSPGHVRHTSEEH